MKKGEGASTMLSRTQVKAIELLAFGDMTQEQVAHKLNLHRNTITKWKKNREFLDELNGMVRKSLDSASANALRIMVSLLYCANEQVKFNAAKDILDRTGYKPKDEVDLRHDLVIIKDNVPKDGS